MAIDGELEQVRGERDALAAHGRRRAARRVRRAAEAVRRHRHRPARRRLVRRLPPEPVGGGRRPHQEAPAGGARALRGVRPPPRSLSGRRGPLVRRPVDPDRVGGLPQPVGRLPPGRARQRAPARRAPDRGAAAAPQPGRCGARPRHRDVAARGQRRRCSAAGSACRSACCSTSSSTARGPTPTRSGGRSSASTGRPRSCPSSAGARSTSCSSWSGAATCWWLYRRFRLDEPERRADFLRTGRVGRDIVPGMSASVVLIVVRHGRTEANASGLLLGRRLDPGARRPRPPPGRRAGRARCPRRPRRSAARCAAPARPRRRSAGPVEIDERWIELDYGELDGTPLRDVPARRVGAVAGRPVVGAARRRVARRPRRAGARRRATSLADEAAERDVIVVTHVSPGEGGAGVGARRGRRDLVPCLRARRRRSPRSRPAGPRPSLHSFNGCAHLDGL